LLYYILLNMFQTLIRPSSGASEYLLCCVDWLEACWCYVAGLSVGDVVSECRLNHCSSGSACTRIPHHQQPIPLHNTSTPQVRYVQLMHIDTETYHTQTCSRTTGHHTVAGTHSLRATQTNKQTNSVALVLTRTIPTERPPPVGEVSANYCG